MPNGTCDPASRGLVWDVGTQTFGPAGYITWEQGWDGVSVRPTCVGPINSLTAVNGNPETWYAHFQGRKGTWQRVTMTPGFNQTFNKNQLRQQGFNDSGDLDGLSFSTDPNPPAA